MPSDSVLIFTLTVFLTSIIPGPSMLLALTHGALYGAKKTLISALGNVTATFLQALISAAGLTALLMASGAAFEIIKWLGAAYLIYMGIMLVRSSGTHSTDGIQQEPTALGSPGRLFTQAFLVTAGNPKAIIFFGAVFPQFIDSSLPVVPQTMVLISICTVCAFICYMTYGIGGQKVSALLTNSPIDIYVKRATGTTFIGSGVALAFTDK